MADELADKKHDATSLRRRRAREEGRYARSSELTSALIFLAGVVCIQQVGPYLLSSIRQLFTSQFTYRTDWLASPETASSDAFWSALGSVWPLLPMFAVLMIVAVASQLGQSRFLMPKLEWSLDWQRLDVVQNMAKLFSMENVSRLGINLVRSSLIAVVAGYTAWTRWQQTRFLDESSLAVAAGAMGQVLLDVLFQVSLLLVILGILDYGYQFWKFEQQLRMTDDELREEAKSTQGDASIKSRRRALQQSMTDSQSYELAEADFVIMDSDGEFAIAIQCDPDNVATPRIVARASRAQVVKLHQSAREQRVATFVDDDLTKSMFERFSPGEELTVEYFEALGRLFVRRTAANSSPQRPKRVVTPVQLAS